MVKRDSHCAFCGALHVTEAWPRACAACANVSYKNPLPVAVLVLPVDDGVLVIRRGLPPVGALALPGGFIDHGERWQDAAARELREEARIEVDPAGIRDLTVRSGADGTLLVFGAAAPMRADALPPFTPTPETTERLVVTSPIDLAFPLHTDVLREWFARR